jgi:hypothetical protein
MMVYALSSTKNNKDKQWFHFCAEGFAYGMHFHIGVDALSRWFILL